MDEIMKLFGSTENIWQYITQYADKAGREATRMVLQLYYVVKSPATPMVDKTLIIAALAYQLLPEDLLSRDKFGLLGFLDNGIALGVAYNRVKARVTPQIEAQVEALLNQWFGCEQPTPGSAEWNEVPQQPAVSDAPPTVRVPIVNPTLIQSARPKPLTPGNDDVIID